MSDVNITINKELINPIIKEKINQAILEALGGKEELVKTVVEQIISAKVNEKGIVDNYSNYNKFNWLDIAVTKQIRAAVEIELKEQIANSTSSIKEALISQLRTKKGSSTVAKALLDGLNGSFKHNWTSKININIEPNFKSE